MSCRGTPKPFARTRSPELLSVGYPVRLLDIGLLLSNIIFPDHLPYDGEYLGLRSRRFSFLWYLQPRRTIGTGFENEPLSQQTPPVHWLGHKSLDLVVYLSWELFSRKPLFPVRRFFSAATSRNHYKTIGRNHDFYLLSEVYYDKKKKKPNSFTSS